MLYQVARADAYGRTRSDPTDLRRLSESPWDGAEHRVCRGKASSSLVHAIQVI